MTGAVIRTKNSFGRIYLLSRGQQLVVATHPIRVQKFRRAGFLHAPELLLGPLQAFFGEINAARTARDHAPRRDEERIRPCAPPALHPGRDGSATIPPPL